MPRIYRSKIDGFVKLAAFGLVAALVLAVRTQQLHPATGSWPLIAFVGALSLGLVLWTVLGTYYTIDDARLRVRSGPFSWVIDLKDIESVTPTRSPLSSPALSLDRLRIDYGGGHSLMVSPGDKEAFVKDLMHHRDRWRSTPGLAS